MNVRLQYDLEFLGGIYFEEQMQMNHYSVSLNLVTGTADPTDTNIAMDRIKAFVFGELEHSVFINVAQRERADLMHLMGINVTTLPEEPVDQIIGMMLHSKLSAVMGGCMLIRTIMLSSTAGDDVIYEHDAQESAAPFDTPGWWTESTPVCESQSQHRTNDTVFVLNTTDQWRELGLQWIKDVEPDQDSNVLVFTEFKNDKDK